MNAAQTAGQKKAASEAHSACVNAQKRYEASMRHNNVTCNNGIKHRKNG